jgi:lipopolysaccharide biosynthesis regulator YciM
VRVHEHLLGRADLKASDRARAQLALAHDYMKAGLFDRAEAAWGALAGTVFDGEAQLALLSLYERSRDWPRALDIARQLEAAGGGSFTSRIAHYECELAEEADARAEPGDQQVADAALDRARQAAPHTPRPLLLTGQRLFKRGDPWRRCRPGIRCASSSQPPSCWSPKTMLGLRSHVVAPPPHTNP